MLETRDVKDVEGEKTPNLNMSLDMLQMFKFVGEYFVGGEGVP